MNTTPPCAGQWDLFDSTDPVDHREAVALCKECPIIEHCAQQLAESRAESHSPAYGPAGTWAGKLVGAPSTLRSITAAQRHIAEDAAYTDEEARDCAARWHRGERSDYVRNGRRIYERRGRERRATSKRETAA